MEAFIVETKQLVGLSKNELQKVWDKLVNTTGTVVYESIMELNPIHINAISIKAYDYVGVLESNNSTFFTDDLSKLKGNIINVQEFLKKGKMKPFIVKTEQLKNLCKEDLQRVWDMLKSTDGTSVYERIMELNPKNTNASSINDFSYLGVSKYSHDTTFTNYSSILQGEIIDINTLIKVPTEFKQIENKIPHVHEVLIKEWAEGAQIQAFNDGKWEDCFPLWNKYVQYRVKPRSRFTSTVSLENTGEYDSSEVKEILLQYYPEAEIHLDIDERVILLKFNIIINLEEVLGKLPELYITFKELNVTFN